MEGRETVRGGGGAELLHSTVEFGLVTFAEIMSAPLKIASDTMPHKSL